MRPSDFAGIRVSNPRRLSRDEYHRMGEVGILTASDRTELLDGEITTMSPIGSRHNGVVNFLNAFFGQQLQRKAQVQIQGSLALDDLSEPQPDILLLKPRPDYYRSALATPADVLLLIEVADTTVAQDRGPKAELYARAAIQEYWVIDLSANVLIVHRKPAGTEFAEVLRLESGKAAFASPQAFADCKLSLSELFS